MATLKTNAPATWNNNVDLNVSYSLNPWKWFTAFADSQQQNHTLWFFLVLIVHGVFFLPLPAVLMYYYDAPVGILVVTMLCFFTNLITTMGGGGIRAAITMFAASILTNLAMTLIFVL